MEITVCVPQPSLLPTARHDDKRPRLSGTPVSGWQVGLHRPNLQPELALLLVRDEQAELPDARGIERSGAARPVAAEGRLEVVEWESNGLPLTVRCETRPVGDPVESLVQTESDLVAMSVATDAELQAGIG